ncbi:aluminum-activated malate transporter 8-like [Arachis stenosperma]|uniref:aluminum-activated malate transporter 8-like n=1 Tax=Arachis stenosperma TaxID=217475 RepID=UPI0025AC35F9|nr:aluminum-activated malate transporter 8-like [Arachis stenosperma]
MSSTIILSSPPVPLSILHFLSFPCGTLSKGVNRGCATLLAGVLGVGGHHLATAFGKKGEPIVLGALVFILGKRRTSCEAKGMKMVSGCKKEKKKKQ